MFFSGLVSISFRDRQPEAILQAMAACGLGHIEWGSDVHGPADDPVRLRELSVLQAQHGIRCCSYGTYFRLGHTPIQELPQYIRAAKILGTDILRLWAGRKKAPDCTEAEREFLLDQCRQAAALAEAEGVTLCLECHRRSYTETWQGALELMEQVNSPSFRMYWQPNPDISREENLEYISRLQPYITHIHVFHWVGDQRLPLAQGTSVWKQYLSRLQGNHCLLLEFMPDDRMESLETEATALLALV